MTYKDNVSGVVIAQCKSMDDKKQIMHSKYNTIVKTIREDKLQMKGNRVVRKGYNSVQGQNKGKDCESWLDNHFLIMQMWT